jgi:hypothetical protein
MFPDFLLTNALAQLAATKEARDAPLSRANLFIATALQLCEFFLANPKLDAFKFTTLLKVDDLHSGSERTISQVHHIKVVAQWVSAPPGQPELLDADGKTRFFYEAMPFWLMGTGTFNLSRADPLLQDLMAAETGSDDKRVKAYALALELDSAFQTVSRECYIGEIQ